MVQPHLGFAIGLQKKKKKKGQASPALTGHACLAALLQDGGRVELGVETGKDLPHHLFSDCRGRLAHLVPEEKMVLKARRVVVVPMVILVLWDPLGRRFVFIMLDHA